MKTDPPAGPPPADRPFILVNMAISADGKTAPAAEPFTPFGGKRDEANLYTLRAGADAILCGAGTLNSGDVALDTGGARFERLRRRHGLAPHAARVLVSGRGGLDPDAKVFQHQAGPILIWVSKTCPQERIAAYESKGAQVEVHGETEVYFPSALRRLKSVHGVQRLVCEGGGRLNNTLFNLGLVDELHLTLCPLILAGAMAPTISDGPGPDVLAQVRRMTLVAQRKRGGAVFLVFRPTPNPAWEMDQLNTPPAGQGW